MKNTESFILASGGHTHIRNSQPYQLHASRHALTGQAFSTNKKSTTHQIQPETKYPHTNISIHSIEPLPLPLCFTADDNYNILKEILTRPLCFTVDDNYNILKEILTRTGKGRPKKCPVTTVTNMATSLFCSCVIWRNLPKIRLAYQDYVAKYCWYVYDQCNNSNYKAKYTTSSNSRQNFMKIGWIAACR